MPAPRIARVFGAVNIGSFRISALIAGRAENGDLMVLGSAHRAAQGVKRGYVVDMPAATYAVRDAIERAEKMANTSVSGVWVGCSGAGLASRIAHVENEIGGRRIEADDIQSLLIGAREVIQPEGRMVLHASPAHYTLDGAHGVTNPKGLHAERLGVDIHVMLADGAPVRNLTESVQNAHLDVEAVVASPMATALACLSQEERELGVALVEFGGEVTTVSVHIAGMLLELRTIPMGSGDITDAIAGALGIRRFQAERLKCVNGSAIASPADHREMIPVHGPGEEFTGQLARHADEKNRIPRAELISIITAQLSTLMDEISKVLKQMGFSGVKGAQVVFTGGGAELAGLADFAQGALGRPVRIGRPTNGLLKGLPEAHATPGFSTLAGLALYASSDPQDIRTIGPSRGARGAGAGLGVLTRFFHAMRDYF